ncbi:hypothetical protein BC938DRAFT_474954 [Jimgerdemannia flammicorona]|uniref:Uncharacterized protein n=1 Tax=Jimgerdemannia flammicorona TaxID=994334 RepID=A0A433QS48_9FUNG|nr:hypothetical protein BC938DRAFT_474954 [Jimgerdemannia flammicorona]
MTDTNPKEGRNTSCPPGFKIIQDRKFRSRGNTSHVLPCDEDEINRLDYQHYMARRFYDALRTTTLSRGIDIEYPTRLGSLLTDNGFTGVAADYISCPIGWRGRPGVLLQRNMSFLMDALKPSIMPVLGIGEDDYADLAGQFHEDYGACRCYTNAPYAYGRKPLNEGR